VRCELVEEGRRRSLGWFADEVLAVAAAAEAMIDRSAYFAIAKRLPTFRLVVEKTEDLPSAQVVERFLRGLTLKSEGGRRWVKRPFWGSRPWLRCS
jgi:hypothetical protein